MRLQYRSLKKRTGRVIGWPALAMMSVLALLLSVCMPAASALAVSQLQQDVNALRDAGDVGVLAEVVHNGNSTKARAGVAKLGTNQEVPFNAHFRTGSTTKTFVATVVVQLVAEGKLSLNDKVSKWLPGVVEGNGYHGNQITVRQLLQHTSGIFDYVEDEDFFATLDTPESFYANRFHTYTPQDLINIALAHPPVFAPGADWSYSNTNYILAGEIIKKVTGKNWRQEVKQRIINPLGLTETTSAGTNPYMPAPFARSYHIYTSDPTQREYTDTTVDNLSWGGAAGDIITTTKDENRFFKALMTGHLLPPAQLAAMKNTVDTGGGFEYGLGLIHTPLSCNNQGFWGHDGGTVGYATWNGITEDGSRSVVLSLSTTSFTEEQYLNDDYEAGVALMDHVFCPGSSANGSNAADRALPTMDKRRIQNEL